MPFVKNLCFFASGYSKASFYPVGQATAAIEKSLQVKNGFARSWLHFLLLGLKITKQWNPLKPIRGQTKQIHSTS